MTAWRPPSRGRHHLGVSRAGPVASGSLLSTQLCGSKENPLPLRSPELLSGPARELRLSFKAWPTKDDGHCHSNLQGLGSGTDLPPKWPGSIRCPRPSVAPRNSQGLHAQTQARSEVKGGPGITLFLQSQDIKNCRMT